MAKVQTRRSISVGRDTYERLKAHCQERTEHSGATVSMSGTLERLVNRYLDQVEADRG